jgi:hypothetical protein
VKYPLTSLSRVRKCFLSEVKAEISGEAPITEECTPDPSNLSSGKSSGEKPRLGGKQE